MNKNNDNKTALQRLGSIFDSNDSSIVTNKDYNNYEPLYKGESEEEYNLAKLEAQQNKYLNDQWIQTNKNSIHRAIQNEATRYGSYADFEHMEHFPEIASALDTYMEEATVSKDGVMLNITSESSRIESVLKELFEDTLKINAVLPMWTRHTCKYGDNFVLLRVASGKGVVDAKQAPIIEMERNEGILANNYRDGEIPKTKFIWRNQNLVFNEWQVAHFRLLGDDRKLPYGTSILEKCRRIYKQLMLAEDAMLVYRVTRAPERRVFKIHVGNIDDKDVPAYVHNIAKKFKRAPIIDPKTGNYDIKYNQVGNDQDYFIPVRDENSPSPIDTLPGATNLDAIADIEYLQNKLCIALRVPKTFLGFSDSVGEGKNLSLMDVRFARSINRVQQSMIQELNKIAIIHLYLLGFTDDLTNFRLSLNNPSNASELAMLDEITTKTDAFIKLVSDAGDGFKVMSRKRASKLIWKMSNDDVMEDLLEQRIEIAASNELKATSKVIKHTGIYDKVDRIYGDIDVAKKGAVEDAGLDKSGGGGSGGLDFGGVDDSDFNEEIDDGFDDIESDVGGLENELDDNTEDNPINEDTNSSFQELIDSLDNKKDLNKINKQLIIK